MEKKLPVFEKDGFILRSGLDAHNSNPDTFSIPPIDEIQKLDKGNIVKLIFEIQTIDEKGQEEINLERMWVTIIEREGEWFTGLLDNQPFCTDDIHPGTKLSFNSEHIIDISPN